MTYQDWVDLFGLSIFHPKLQVQLAQAGVSERPKIPRNESFTLVSAGDGMTIGFFDESLFPQMEEAVGGGTPVLGSVLMSLEDDEPYSGPLPFNVRQDSTREELRQRFGLPQDSTDTIPGDEWLINGLVLRVWYAKNLQSILRLRLRHPAVN